jgi:hypothetical protein
LLIYTFVRNYFKPDGNMTGKTKWYGEMAAAVGNIDTHRDCPNI